MAFVIKEIKSRAPGAFQAAKGNTSCIVQQN